MNLDAVNRSIARYLRSPAGQWIVVAALLVVFLALGALSVRDKTMTTDEGIHYLYGQNILNGDSDRFDDSKMPISALNALPARLAQFLPEGPVRTFLDERDFFIARMVTLGFSTLVALLVYIWTRKLYGFIPALFSLTMYILDPNIIAHSQLVTTDLYALGSIALASFCLWLFAHNRTWGNGLLCAFTLALSQISKYSSLPLYGLFLIALLAYDVWMGAAANRNRWQMLKSLGFKCLLYSTVGLAVFVLVVNVTFLFNRTLTRFGDYHFRSHLFQSLQTNLTFLSDAPIPVPYPYLEGLDWVVYRERTGQGYGNIYLLGETRAGQGFKGYFIIASLFKVPIAAQILTLAAVIRYGLDRNRRRTFLSDEIFLLLPVTFYAIYFNFFYNTQLGIRYYLVIFPLLYIFTGNLFTAWDQFAWQWKAVSLGLICYLVTSVLAYYPYYLTYFNEIVWDKTQTYKYLADSNLDWGQSELDLKRYLAEHPDATSPHIRPESGHFIVSADRLVGIISDPERFRWLRENFKPIGTVANCYFIYKISPAELSNLCRTTTYCKSPQ